MKKILWTKKQSEYINLVIKNPMKYNFQWGATGTGKTFADIRYLIPYKILEKRDKEGLNIIAGVSEGTVKRNVLEPLCDFWGEKYVSKIVTNNCTKIFGETVYVLGAEKINQLTKFQGSTIKNIFCDEIAKWHSNVFNYIHTRLRANHSQLFATFNPESPNHFIHEFVENDMPKNVVHSNLYDNTFLSEQTIKDFEMAYPKGTVYYTRYILGLPCRAEGIIFPNFANDPTNWTIKLEELPDKFKYCEVGFDIGGNGSAYALTCTARGFDGVQYKLMSEKKQANELNMHDVLKFVVEFCENCEKKYNVVIDMINCDHSQVVINSINSETSYRACLCVKPPLSDRIMLYSKLLATQKVKFVKNMCNDLIFEMQNLVFDERAEDTRPLDDGSMQIDTWDSNIYSESSYWNYILND